jgi:hypothetical protein
MPNVDLSKYGTVIGGDDDLSKYGTVIPAAPAPQNAPQRKTNMTGTKGLDRLRNFLATGDPNQPYDKSPEWMSRQTGQFVNALPYAGAAAATMLAPEGVLPAVGAAMLGGMTGATAQQIAAKAMGLPEAPKSLNEATTNIGNAALEQGAYELGGRAIGSAAGRMFGRYLKPQEWYQSALAPPPSTPRTDVMRMVRAGIENRVPVSEAGISTAENMWRELNKKIDDIIDAYPNAPVNPRDVVSGLQGLRRKYAAGSGDPAFGKAIDEIEKNFLANHPQMTGRSAQEAKKAIYDEIRMAKRGAWNGQGVNPISVQAKQEIAGALKQKLEQIYPELRSLNEKEGALIELERSLERFANRESNKRMTPYFAPLLAAGAAGAGTALGHAGLGAEGGLAIMGAHFLRSALEDPEVKSKIAFALAKAGKSAAGRASAAAAPYLAPNALRSVGAAVNIPPPPPGYVSTEDQR